MLSRDPDFLVRDIGQTSTAPCSGFSPELFCFNTNTITVTFKVVPPSPERLATFDEPQIQRSMSLKYEPASEPLHISVN